MAIVRRYNQTYAPVERSVNDCECKTCGQPLEILPTAVDKALTATRNRYPSITRGEIFGRSREYVIASARRYFMAEMHWTQGWHPERIANLLGRERTTVLHALGMTKKSNHKRRIAA